jgi:hypothetical protein
MREEAFVDPLQVDLGDHIAGQCNPDFQKHALRFLTREQPTEGRSEKSHGKDDQRNGGPADGHRDDGDAPEVKDCRQNSGGRRRDPGRPPTLQVWDEAPSLHERGGGDFELFRQVSSTLVFLGTFPEELDQGRKGPCFTRRVDAVATPAPLAALLDVAFLQFLQFVGRRFAVLARLYGRAGCRPVQEGLHGLPGEQAAAAADRGHSNRSGFLQRSRGLFVDGERLSDDVEPLFEMQEHEAFARATIRARHCGRQLVAWFFVLTATAYNLVRIPKILAATG